MSSRQPNRRPKRQPSPARGRRSRKPTAPPRLSQRHRRILLALADREPMFIDDIVLRIAHAERAASVQRIVSRLTLAGLVAPHRSTTDPLARQLWLITPAGVDAVARTTHFYQTGLFENA